MLLTMQILVRVGHLVVVLLHVQITGVGGIPVTKWEVEICFIRFYSPVNSNGIECSHGVLVDYTSGEVVRRELRPK